MHPVTDWAPIFTRSFTDKQLFDHNYLFSRWQDGWWCKLCDAPVPKGEVREDHAEGHKTELAGWRKSQKVEVPEHIQRLRELKANQPTAKDAGVPDVYLAESGNFKPGYDAKFKSDLVNSILGFETKLMTFDEDTAREFLRERGWTEYLAKARERRGLNKPELSIGKPTRKAGKQPKLESDAEIIAEVAGKVGKKFVSKKDDGPDSLKELLIIDPPKKKVRRKK